MSQDKPKDSSIDGSDLHIGIVASRYNGDLVDDLLDRVRAVLRKSRVAEGLIRVLRVPGAAELPYVINMLAQTDEYDCLIALGVVIKGDTNHDDVIAHSTALSLQGISLQTEIPVINGIICVNDHEQAEERITGKTNRGAEFAQAALEMGWHRVHLKDYLDQLDAQAEREEMEAEGEEFFGFNNEDDDDDDSRRPPFNKN